ncbi:MAG: exonuclease SbcCD subunit D C-terminal domain-containing protein [Saprospiraceae bacterium]|nr:exonuclease SbcCD subunit D C-terminal domain-containing protein [Saprospiraceae bacterium]
MKILHTSDWHLGQKFLSNDREEEHRRALLWLVETVQTEQVDALLVAGDVFDIGNPPHYARRLYYDFLTRMLKSPCRHIIITGGNHDSPSMLNAPRELLRALNVHVVGAATGNIEDEIVELRNPAGQLEAVVAAVPFLRDGDLRASVSGEGAADRMEHLKKAILQHYRAAGEYCEQYRRQNVPIIAAGHLYATGALASDKQDNIYIGNMDNIDARQFPDVFDYVALGHIHRAQAVGGIDRVRYSGSLIPLSFSETKDDKVALLVAFEGKTLSEVKTLPVPVYRRLKTIQGSIEEVERALQKFAAKPDRDLTPWVEIIVDSEQFIPQLDARLHEFTKGMELDILKIRLNRPVAQADALQSVVDLHTLSPVEVFEQRCRHFAADETERADLMAAFAELQTWMHEQEEEAV